MRFWLALGLLALCLARVAAAANCTMPDVTGRVGRGQNLATAFSQPLTVMIGTRDWWWANEDPNGQHESLSGGPVSGFYILLSRWSVNGHRDTVRDWAWFNTNHPTWVLYAADQITPAFQFSDTNYVPLNVQNSSVRTFMENGDPSDASSNKGGISYYWNSAYFCALSVDNVDSVNRGSGGSGPSNTSGWINGFSVTGTIASGQLTVTSRSGLVIVGSTISGPGIPSGVTISSPAAGTTPGGIGVYNLAGADGVSVSTSESISGATGGFNQAAAGVCSVALKVVGGVLQNCTASGGTFTKLYSGTFGDSSYYNAMLSWLKALKSWAKSNLKGGPLFWENVAYEYTDQTGTSTVAGQADLVLSESGFFEDCHPVCGSYYCGTAPSNGAAAWAGKVNFYAGITGGGKGVAVYDYMTEDSCWLRSQVPQNAWDFAVASYLMVKPQSGHPDYVYWVPSLNDYTGYTAATFQDFRPELYLQQGKPTAAMVHDRGNCYVRTFSSGVIALINPDSVVTCSYALTRTYHDYGCVVYSGTQVLGPVQAHVLLPGSPASGCTPAQYNRRRRIPGSSRKPRQRPRAVRRRRCRDDRVQA